MKIGDYTLSNWWYIASTKENKMDPETKQRKQSALKTLLRQLDVPAMRMDVTNVGNLRWLMRNLAVRNNEHPMLDTIFTMIRELLRGK
jgi:hypothetical protein